MRKTATVTIALLSLLIALPAVPADDGSTPENTPWTLILTPDGHEFLPNQTRGQEECQGDAPAVTHCTTGLHATTEVWAVALGASFTYTGTLEVRLFHATSVLVAQVHVIDGDPVGFNLYGQFPITPAIFWHECFSYDLAEAGNDPMPLPYAENGTPGGSGAWDCFVLYP